MKISLKEFEHQIEEKILNRGFDYFKKGIEEAFSVLDALCESELSEAQHNDLFKRLLTLFYKNTLKGRDWHFKSIALAINLLKTDREKQQIKSTLDKIKPTGKSWDWDYRKARELMLALIKKQKTTTLLNDL
jgi:hypothetical protein